MNTFIQSIQQLFQRLFGGGGNPEAQSEKIVTNLMNALEMTQDHELSCDEVFELLDEYAELIINNQDARKYMPLVAHHLEMCSHCREEFEALIEVMRIEVA